MENVLQKIKKLLALSKSSNINEAAVALRKARELMDANGVTASDLNLSDINETRSYPFPARKIPEYVNNLVLIICKLFQCDAYFSTESYFYRNSASNNRFETYPVFVGFETSQKLASYTYENLVRKLISARKAYTPENARKLSRGEMINAKDSFAEGWTLSVHKKIEHLLPPPIEIEVPSETGLILINPLSVYVKEKTTGKVETRESNSDISNYLAGVTAGSKIDIRKPLENEDQAYLTGAN